MENEFEVKLRLPPDAVPRLSRHPGLAALREGRPRTRRLTSVYFDTEDRSLAREGIALRVRHAGRFRIQTVKTRVRAGAGAAHSNTEWSAEIEGDRPELERVGDAALRAALARRANGGLAEAFRSEISRRTQILVVDGTRVEMALDRGVIRAGTQEEPVCEVELELLSGESTAVYDIALMLAESLPATVEHRSKAERGYRLGGGAAPGAARADRLDLPRDASVWQGFVLVAQDCLAQFRANQNVVAAADVPEAVHQLRVAVRRLRAAFSAFRPLLDPDRAAPLAGDLRWLQRAFGPARDWDVLIEETLDPLLRALPGRNDLPELAGKAAEARAAGYVRARAALADRRCSLLLLRLGRWLEEPAASQAAAEPLRPYAASVLDRMDRKLKKAGRHLESLGAVELHGLRIRAKKARYGAEFFRGLFDAKKVRRYAGALREIQDHLGSLNDAAVARRLLADPAFAADDSARLLVEGWFAARIVAGREGLDEVWKGYRKARGFWGE